MGVAGMLLTTVGAMLLAASWFYFDLSLWLLIPGGALMLIGSSLLSGHQEQIRLSVSHRIADSQSSKNKDSGDSAP
jgi:hypothetical protein